MRHAGIEIHALADVKDEIDVKFGHYRNAALKNVDELLTPVARQWSMIIEGPGLDSAHQGNHLFLPQVGTEKEILAIAGHDMEGLVEPIDTTASRYGRSRNG